MVEPYEQKVKIMNLVAFNYNTNVIRTQVTDEGEPLFCLADICKVLDGNQPNKVAEAIREEFGLTELNSDSLVVIPVDTGYGIKGMTFITEPQLYFVLMRSRSENARPFRQWVVNDVLPSIRKTGKYEVKQTTDLKLKFELTKMLLEPAGITGNQLTLALDKVYRTNTGESLLAQTGVELKAPTQSQLLTPTQIGERLDGRSAKAINLLLQDLGLQRKVGKEWELTQLGRDSGGVYLDTNKRHSNGTPIRQIKWPDTTVEYLAQCYGKFS